MFELGNEVLGVAFVVLALVLTFLMYYLWGFPFDHERHKSAAPRSLVNIHRLLGYVFVAIYLYLMADMVPRLWTYQVELPARTVAHLLLGMAIGSILLIKIVIVRFFKHMEAKLAPALGTALLVCTLLLLGLALPTTFREAFLHDAALDGGNMSADRLTRVREQLPKAGIEDPALVDQLSTRDALFEGRQVLMSKCVQCHDLRTILARPRTPDEWRRTVERMASRSSVVNLIDEAEELRVTAYLVAISPTLQRTARLRREQALETSRAQRSLSAAKQGAETMDKQASAADLGAAKSVFEARCSQCHSPALVAASPPTDEAAATDLVSRMVRNGLRADDEELMQIIAYLAATYGEAQIEPNESESTDESSEPSSTDSPNALQGSSASGSLGSVDEQIILRPDGTSLGFAEPEVKASAGSTIRLTLENPSSSGQTHNVVLIRDSDAYDDVSDAALGAPDSGFVPQHEQVIASIPAQSAGSSASVEFKAPKAGRYKFGCLMPGHSFTMQGNLTIE